MHDRTARASEDENGGSDARVTVVTGAAQGIGLEIARTLAGAGHRVLGIDLVAPPAAHGLDDFEQMDLTNRAEFDELLKDRVPRLGDLYGLVNNAAVSPIIDFLASPLDALDATYAVNVRGSYGCAQSVARALVADGAPGSIVNIGSVHGELGTSGMAAYATSKGALAALTRTLAIELAPHGIRCNLIAPGPTSTPRLRDTLSEADFQQRTQRIPLGRLAREEDVAQAAAYLMSSGAEFVTGSTLTIDGGYSAKGMS